MHQGTKLTPRGPSGKPINSPDKKNSLNCLRHTQKLNSKKEFNQQATAIFFKNHLVKSYLIQKQIAPIWRRQISLQELAFKKVDYSNDNQIQILYKTDQGQCLFQIYMIRFQWMTKYVSFETNRKSEASFITCYFLYMTIESENLPRSRINTQVSEHRLVNSIT